MTYPELEAFLTIIKTGSISAAAEQLYVTQPALSRRIRSLEDELGYTLFVRSKGIRSVTLTPEGQAFISVAEKWNHVYREARAISTLNQKSVLNVSAVGSVSTYLLPDVFRRIIAGESPYNLCFHNYHSYEAYDYVAGGLVDIALISDDMYHKTVITTPAFREPFVLVGGPAWDSVDTIRPDQLDPRKEIRLPWNPEFDAWHERWFDVTIFPKVQLDQMSLLEELLTDDLFAVTPLHVAKKLRNGQMHVCRLENGPVDEIIYYLTCRSRNRPLIDHFLSLLRDELETYEGIYSFI